MHGKLFRFFVALATAVAALGVWALAADASSSQYCDPLSPGSCQSVKVSPSSVRAGHAINVSGGVGAACKKPAQVAIYSRAFQGATTHKFAGVPAIFSTTNRTGVFSKRVTIRKTIRPGRYHVGARCGRRNVGSATLTVTKR